MSDSYYLRVRGLVRGPFTLEQLLAMRSQGQLQRFHEVSTDQLKWVAAGSVIELFFSGPSGPPAVVEEVPLMAVELVEPVPPPKTKEKGFFKTLLGALYRHRLFIGAAIALGIGCPLTYVFATKLFKQEPVVGDQLPIAVRKILETHCLQCHGKEHKLNVMDRDGMMTGMATTGKRYLKPGNSKESEIWLQASTDHDKLTKLSDREKVLLERWISFGAQPFP